jgi:hypothetical protein
MLQVSEAVAGIQAMVRLTAQNSRELSELAGRLKAAMPA